MRLPECALFMEQRCGKTMTALGIAAGRHLEAGISRVLVVTVKAAMISWEDESTLLNVPYKLYTLGSKLTLESRKEVLRFLKRKPPTELTFVLINWEVFYRLKKELKRWSPQMVILDESHKIKNHASQVARVARTFATAPYKLLLSGTPIGNDCRDMFGQYRFLKPDIFGTSFREFEDRYVKYFKNNKMRFKRVRRYTKQKEFRKKVFSVGYRVKASEALDLPPYGNQFFYVDLEESRAKYNSMWRDMLLYLEGEVMEAPVILTKYLMCHQICGGWLKFKDVDADEETKRIVQVGTEKFSAFKDIVSGLDTDKKFVVFTNYIAEAEAIGQYLQTKFPTEIYAGKHSDLDSIRRFQRDPDVKAIVIQIKKGGVGIDLSMAANVIFYSLCYSFLDYDQAYRRVLGPAQKHNVSFIHLFARNTVDEEIWKAVIGKQNLADVILDKWRNHGL